MPSPPIQVFLTSIASNVVLRQRQEYILRILQSKKAQFTSYDLASDEDAKKLWKRKAPAGNQQLPGILVGGVYPGTFEELEDAVEAGEIDRFFRLNESWDSSLEANAMLKLDEKPISVPGLVFPSRVADSTHKPSPPSAPTPSPSIMAGVAAAAAAAAATAATAANPPLSSSQKTKTPLVKAQDTKKGELDASENFGDPSLDADLAKLAKELRLEDSETDGLVRGLVSGTASKGDGGTGVAARVESADDSGKTGDGNDANSITVHETPATDSASVRSHQTAV